MTSEKQCIGCRQTKPLEDFGLNTTKGHVYVRSRCKSCDHAARLERQRRHAESAGFWKRTSSGYEKRNRADLSQTPKWILKDSRKSDQRAGRLNDLDLPFIQNLVVAGCAYCGETALRMTVDRIDNLQGHLKANVVPACIRCNYVRGNMPYAAWVIVAKGMREARSLALFGEWVSKTQRK